MLTINGVAAGAAFPVPPAGAERRIKFAVGQLESGAENGNIHWQICVGFRSAATFDSVRALFPGAHVEPVRNLSAAIEYCRKEDTRFEGVPAVVGPFEWGDLPKGAGKRTDLDALQELVRSGASLETISDQHFGSFLRYSRSIQLAIGLKHRSRSDPSELLFFYGPPGTGKTTGAIALADGLADGRGVYWLTCGGGGDSSKVWWDGYQQQAVVVIDEYYGQLPFSFLLRLCDRAPLRVEYKGGSIDFNSKYIIIISNSHPYYLYRNVPDTAAWRSRLEPARGGRIVYMGDGQRTDDQYVGDMLPDWWSGHPSNPPRFRSEVYHKGPAFEVSAGYETEVLVVLETPPSSPPRARRRLPIVDLADADSDEAEDGSRGDNLAHSFQWEELEDTELY